MKIIDFCKKGNVVRFYLGEDDLDKWWGDDWDDFPYDCNAGEVYDRFISGHKDITFPFDEMVLEPCSGDINCGWCKNDMIQRKVPCIIVIPKEIADELWSEDFARAVCMEGIKKYYFGDKMEPDMEAGE